MGAHNFISMLIDTNNKQPYIHFIAATHRSDPLFNNLMDAELADA